MVTIKKFTLFADDESSFTGATNLGDFTFTNVTDSSVQVYDFTDIQAQFIRLRVIENNGNPNFIVHREVAFDTVPSAVPVPAAVWLFGSALIGLVGLRKKKA